jgi:hypothetical protein
MTTATTKVVIRFLYMTYKAERGMAAWHIFVSFALGPIVVIMCTAEIDRGGKCVVLSAMGMPEVVESA